MTLLRGVSLFSPYPAVQWVVPFESAPVGWSVAVRSGSWAILKHRMLPQHCVHRCVEAHRRYILEEMRMACLLSLRSRGHLPYVPVEPALPLEPFRYPATARRRLPPAHGNIRRYLCPLHLIHLIHFSLPLIQQRCQPLSAPAASGKRFFLHYPRASLHYFEDTEGCDLPRQHCAGNAASWVTSH